MKIHLAAKEVVLNVTNEDGTSVMHVAYTDYVGELDLAAAIRGGGNLMELAKTAFMPKVDSADAE